MTVEEFAMLGLTALYGSLLEDESSSYVNFVLLKKIRLFFLMKREKKLIKKY